MSFFHYFTQMFRKRKKIFEVEEGIFLSPKFDGKGLVPVITTDFKSGDVLMHERLKRAFNRLAGADLLDLGLLLAADLVVGDCQRCQGPLVLHASGCDECSEDLGSRRTKVLVTEVCIVHRS